MSPISNLWKATPHRETRVSETYMGRCCYDLTEDAEPVAPEDVQEIWALVESHRSGGVRVFVFCGEEMVWTQRCADEKAAMKVARQQAEKVKIPEREEQGALFALAS